MKVIVNKAFFLGQALPVASYGNTVNFRIPADVVEPGQVDLTFEEWQQLLAKVQQSPDAMVKIEL